MPKEHSDLPMTRQFTNALNIGRRYRVRYTLDRGRGALQYEMVAVYLGWRDRYPGRHTDWSGRPAFGTTTVPEEHLTACWPAKDTEKVSLPKRVREQ